MTRRNRIVGLVAVAGLAAGAVWWASRPRTTLLAARPLKTTALGFKYNTPPPWPRGNRLSLTADPHPASSAEWWLILNMHAENFGELSGRLGWETVEVLPVGPRRCLIVDPRVPSEWLLDGPLDVGLTPNPQDELVTKYPQHFRPAP